jgi:hypothetical protein
MFDPGRSSRPIGRGAFAVALSALSLAAGAGAASAATLHVAVNASVKKGQNYVISVGGTFSKGEVQGGKAFLVSVIQFGSKPCLSTIQKEGVQRQVQWYLAPGDDPTTGKLGVFEAKSPFTKNNGFTAKTAGARHVCAYLYPKRVSKPSDATAPIAKADTRYKVTK